MSDLLRNAIKYRAQYPFCANPVEIALWKIDYRTWQLDLHNRALRDTPPRAKPIKKVPRK